MDLSARMVGQLLHGCRQLVPWGVPLSRRTSATRIRCYKCHRRLPWLMSGRKERTTSSQHGAYDLGHTHPTMANNNGTQARKRKQIPSKFRLSSDWGLQPDPMKSESVVIADQQAAVNTFSGLVHTARQANKVGGGRRAPQGELSRIQRWGLSRNKVSLAEAGDGSPPF
jgi:hypothetical protein